MRKRILILATVFGIALGLAALPAGAMTRTVNCDKGETIQAAIEKSESRAERLEILVSGTCDESLVIRRSEVTIDGGGSATLLGPVSVFADNVWLYNLTVKTSGRGIVVSNGSARVWSAALTGNNGEGLLLRRNAFVWLRDSTVTDNAGAGISVDASKIDVQNTTVSGNGSHGIALAFNSQSTISESTITENGGSGILLTAGSQANIDNNVINNNANHGVNGYLRTTLVLHGNEIAYNSWAGVAGFGRTTIQIGGAQINYNGDDGIGLSGGSTLILEEPSTTLIGNTNAALWCGDAQSYVNDLALLDTEGDKGCLEFGW